MTHNGFLSLPRELRDAVYEHLVVKPTNTITMLENHNCFANEISAAQPAISRVNKQIRAESLPMFYKRNLFLAELSNSIDLATATSWLHALGDWNAGYLRRLALRGWTKVAFGHMECRLWLRMTFDLQDGTLGIEGHEAAIDGHRHVLKDMQGMKDLWALMVRNRKVGSKNFDVVSLQYLMEGFYGMCTENGPEHRGNCSPDRGRPACGI